MGNAASSPPPPSSPSTAMTELMDAAVTRLRRQLTSDRSLALYEAFGSHVVDASTGGVLFWLGITGAQLLQRGLRVGSSTRVAPRVIGTIAVASSSAIALHFASLPRELCAQLTDPASPESTPFVQLQQTIVARAQDLRDAPYPIYMLMGVLCFKMLGGRMRSLAPSPYADLGAFHLRKASLPATDDYASAVERGIIQEFGRLFGCHTCGVRKSVIYHADHMPPRKVAKQMNAQWWRRLSGRQVEFRFYPQCGPCSNTQGTVVKRGGTDLRTHASSLRMYHSTGLWLVLLCTGGLYVGGSSFHDNADVAPAATREEQPETEDTAAGSSSGHTVLRSLRERERSVQRQRATAHDSATIARLDAELQAIRECKAQVKANLRAK
ncbi:hypothetical protein ATCC90586_002233 [Pythium insidiosum]|nr:hypothetical protein ATCC90586_002233 [Pythium insidiosum]